MFVCPHLRSCSWAIVGEGSQSPREVSQVLTFISSYKLFVYDYRMNSGVTVMYFVTSDLLPQKGQQTI